VRSQPGATAIENVMSGNSNMHRPKMTTNLVAWLISGTLLLAAVTPVVAAGELDVDKWAFYGEVYLWGADIKGESSAGDDVDIPFSDLIDNLDIAYMGKLAARKDKLSLFADIIYLDVEDDVKSTANLIGYPFKTDADVQLQGFVTTLGEALDTLNFSGPFGGVKFHF